MGLSTPLEGTRALVVAESAHERRELAALLEAWRVSAVEAADGWDALREVARAAEAGRLFDVVLADAALPGMDGRDLARRLVQTSFGRRPVLLMVVAGAESSVPSPEVRMLHKPLTGAALEAACLAALGGTPASASADDPLAALPGVQASIGRAATRGNDQLYRRLLLLFLKTQRDFPARFAAAQAGSDPTAPTRYAHDLKATAGSLGMVDLQRVAADLEAACFAGTPPDELVEAVRSTLAPILAGLERLAPP